MKKNILCLLILISGILISGGIISFAHAQTTTPADQTEQQKNLSNIQYPIAELNNCADQASCKTYCDSPNNTNACINFAEQKNIFTKNEVATAKKFIDTGSKGPGSCSGQAACEQYCGDPTNIEECTAFAEKNGMMSDQQLQDSKKVIAAIKSGLKPPACAGPEKCQAYCSSSEHMQECMTFSLAAGMVPDSQKVQMQKTLDAFKQGIKPPACQPNPPSESGQSGQPNQPNQNQPKQTNQSGLQTCDEYCADSSHVEECVKFSVAIGNMTQEQGQNAIKNGNKGPGGCIGKDACNTFCDNPDNQETCFNFAKNNGMISEEDLQNMQDGQPRKNQSGQNQNNQGQINEQIQPWADMCQPDGNGNPTELACADDAGGFVTDAKIGTDKQPVCPTGSTAKCGNYPQIHQQGQNQQNKNKQNQQGQQGNKFQPGSGAVNQGGQQMPQQAGPGGCKGPEECQKYCASNPEVCKNFQPPQNGQGQSGGPNQQNQPSQMQTQQQFNQGGESGQNQPGQPNQLNQINQPGQQPSQMPIEQQQQQQEDLPPPLSSLLQGAHNFLANVLSAFR